MNASDTTKAPTAARARRRKPGRPPKWGAPLEKVWLHVPHPVRVELERLAKEHGCSISEAAILRILPDLFAAGRSPRPRGEG